MTDVPIRALVTRAGSGGSGNVIRALRAIRPTPAIIGVNHDRFTIRASLADSNRLVSEPTHPEFIDALLDIVERDQVNLIIGTDENAIKALSDARDRFPIDLFLPRRETIDVCQDKHAMNVFFRDRGIPVPRFYAVGSLDDLPDIFAQFEGEGVLWCRIRRGSLSLGATAVTTLEQARSWITQWRDLRGKSVADFELGEYLPGRHFIVVSVWHAGRLLLAQATEVISYFAAGNNPSGSFSLTNLAKTVVAPRVLRTALDAIRTLEDAPTGAFIVEFKEAANGTPAIMEINAGRFPSGVTTLLAACPTNMVELFARAAVGDARVAPDPHGTAEELYLVQDLDCLPTVVSAAALLDAP